MLQALRAQVSAEMRSDPPALRVDLLTWVHSMTLDPDDDVISLPVVTYRLARRCLDLNQPRDAADWFRHLLEILSGEVATKVQSYLHVRIRGTWVRGRSKVSTTMGCTHWRSRETARGAGIHLIWTIQDLDLGSTPTARWRQGQ